MSQKAIRILLADDHTVMRSGLRVLLDRQPGLQVIAEAADGREAVTLAEIQMPDVAVIDIAMPNLNGIADFRVRRSSISRQSDHRFQVKAISVFI